MLNYDDMLNKMNLKYLNGNFYKSDPEPQHEPQPQIKKEDIIKIIRQKQLERAFNRRQQIEKRKLILPSAPSIRPSAPNNFFKLR